MQKLWSTYLLYFFIYSQLSLIRIRIIRTFTNSNEIPRSSQNFLTNSHGKTFSIFQVASFPWNFSVTATVGITSEEVKNRLCEHSRVSFLQMAIDCLIFSDTNCKLFNTIVWFHQYVELFSNTWSPYFLVNMMTLGIRF